MVSTAEKEIKKNQLHQSVVMEGEILWGAKSLVDAGTVI